MTIKRRANGTAQLAAGLGTVPSRGPASDGSPSRMEQQYDGRQLEKELYTTTLTDRRMPLNYVEEMGSRVGRSVSSSLDALVDAGRQYATSWFDDFMGSLPKPFRNYSQRKLNQLERYARQLYTGEDPLVYVVVPAHREAGTIENIVASILNQNHDNLVIDIEINGETGGEADATEKGLGKYLTNDRVHIHKSNPAGIARARNTGTQRALQEGAKLIFYADADAVLTPDAITAVIASYYAGNDGGQGSVPYDTSDPLIQGMASVSTIARLGTSALSELSDDVPTFAAGGGVMWVSRRAAEKMMTTYGYVFPEGRAEDTAALRLLGTFAPTGDTYRPLARQSDRRVVQEGLLTHWLNSVRYSFGYGQGDDFPAYR